MTKRQAEESSTTNAAPPPNEIVVAAAQAPTKKKKKRLGTKNINPDVLRVRREIQKCCSNNDWRMAYHHVYQKALEQNIAIETQTYCNLVHLCAGLGGSQRQPKIHIGTPKTKVKKKNSSNNAKKEDNKETKDESSVNTNDSPTRPDNDDLQERKEAAFTIQQHMEQHQVPLSENIYTALIRIYIQNGEIREAQALLQQALSNIKPKLRLYSSLLMAHAHQGNLQQAVDLWNQIHQQDEMECTEAEYQALLECAVLHGNVQVVQRVVAELANIVLVPSKKTIQSMIQWFESKHSIRSSENEEESNESQLTLPPAKDASLMMIPNGRVTSQHGWTLSYACRMDTTTGTLQSGCCAGTTTLLPVPLPPVGIAALVQMNETIVTRGELHQELEFQGGGKGRKKRFKSQELHARQQQWNAFVEYCSKQKQQPWDVVLDGANIGYYEQNFTGAPKHVEYNKIDWVVQHFQKQGKRVLLVLHERHFASNLMPDWAKPIVAKWNINNCCLYKTPHGANDDWFWFHAALTCGALVVTNDEMRDHSFQMMNPQYLQQWRERKTSSFSFWSL